MPLMPMPEKKPMLAVARVVAGVGAGVARLGRGEWQWMRTAPPHTRLNKGRPPSLTRGPKVGGRHK